MTDDERRYAWHEAARRVVNRRIERFNDMPPATSTAEKQAREKARLNLNMYRTHIDNFDFLWNNRGALETL